MSQRNLQCSSEVNITGFSKKGHGLGATVGDTERIVEVPFTLPGDKVRACFTRKRGGDLYGLNLKDPHPIAS